MAYIQAFPKSKITRKCKCEKKFCIHTYYFVLRINKEPNGYESYSIGYFHEARKKLNNFLKPYPIQSQKTIMNAYRRLDYQLRTSSPLRPSYSISLNISLTGKK